MGYRIGVYDNDQTYVWGLVNYINEKSDSTIMAYGFTCVDILIEAVSMSWIDMIVSGEDIPQLEEVIPVLYMSEDAEANQFEGYIYKYCNMREVVGRIVEYARDRVRKKYGDTFVYAVYSPLGRCGKTSYARKLVSDYGNSIYLGIEEYMPYDRVEGEENTILRGDSVSIENTVMSMENIAFYVSSEDERLIHMIGELPPDDKNNKYIYLADSFEDIRCITADNLRWLLSGLRDFKPRCIVIDIGQTVLGDWNIIDIFDGVFVPVLNDETSYKKLEGFKSFLKRRGCGALLDKLQYIDVREVCKLGQD